MNKLKNISFFLVFALAITFCMPTALRADGVAEIPELKLVDAKELAQKYSNELRKAKIDIEKADIEFERARDNVAMVPLSPWQDPTASAIYQAYLMTQENYFAQKTGYELAVEQLDHKVETTYYDVIKKQLALEIGAQKMAQIEREVTIANLKQHYQLMSAFERRQVLLKRDTAAAELNTARLKLNSAWQELFKLIGARPESFYRLTDRPEYKELKMSESSMRAHAYGISDHKYLTYLPELGATSAKISFDYYYPGYESYHALEKGLQSANYTVTLAKEGYNQAVQSMYYGIKEMEANYEVLLANCEQVRDVLELVELQYELGMVAKQEVDTTRLQLNELENATELLKIEHSLLLKGFYSPWVMMSAGR